MTLNSEEIKAVAIAIIELCLFEGISKSVSPVNQSNQSVSRSVGWSVGRSVSQSVSK